MDKTVLIDLIVETVNESTGIKGTELAVKVAGKLKKIGVEWTLDGNSFVNILNECVKQDKIMEITFILPEMPNKIKSFYLPAGTKVGV